MQNNIFKSLFNNQKKLLLLLYGWMVIVIILFYSMGIMQSDFIKVGPNEKTKFMSITIDNWYKWTFLSVFVLCNTIINSFIAESMGPWVTNTIQDHKNMYLPYSKGICIIIVQTYYFYGNIMSMFGLFAMFAQIDFLLIRTFSECFVCYFTTREFLFYKKHDKQKYDEFFIVENNLEEQLVSNV